MSSTAEKARTLRLERLKSMLAGRLDNPAAALEVLVSELTQRQAQTPLWEELHAAAARDGVEKDLAAAYVKIASPRRLQQLEPWAQADVLVHAADFHQGILGDAGSAETFLERVHHIVPGHAEAFTRLERRFEALGDARGLIGLYALTAAAKPASSDSLVSKAVNKIVPLPATAPLSEEDCKRLVVLVPTHPILIQVLETHCRKTKRLELGCTLLEQAIREPNLPDAVGLETRRRLIELYMVDPATSASAISHVEELLNQAPTDAAARAAAERLLSNRQVAARAAAALQTARRQARSLAPPR
jgi:hypothetical protein